MVNKIKDILKLKEYKNNKLSSSQIKRLNSEGYLLLKPNKKIWKWIGCKPKKLRNIIDGILKSEGLKSGSEGKEENTVLKRKKIEKEANRVGKLLNKSSYFSKVATLPVIVWAASNIIKSEIKLSSILFREPKKKSGDQPLHIDWIPRTNKKQSYKVLVAFLYLEDSNNLNGATRLVPRSHKKLSYPDKYLNPNLPSKNEIIINAKAGSILLINALVWHRGGNNISGKKRGIIVTEYRNRNLKQLLNLKKYVSKDVQKKLSKSEKYLFGLRKNDKRQLEKSYGPGNHYRNWLKNNKSTKYIHQ